MRFRVICRVQKANLSLTHMCQDIGIDCKRNEIQMGFCIIHGYLQILSVESNSMISI
jgi:hypothetical protein